MCFKKKWAIIFDMKKQAVKNLTIFIVLLALIAGAFSCGFFTNDVAYAAVLPDAVSNQWFDGEDYNAVLEHTTPFATYSRGKKLVKEGKLRFSL